MGYWIILLLVLVALAPLWHFMPSKHQRRQASMREAAALAGLYVEFRDLPLPAARKARLPATERQLLYYGYRLPASRGDARKNCAWWREDGGWRSSDPQATVPEIAADLPESVAALSVSEESCGLYWREEGDAQTVRQLAEIMGPWRDTQTEDRSR